MRVPTSSFCKEFANSPRVANSFITIGSSIKNFFDQDMSVTRRVRTLAIEWLQDGNYKFTLEWGVVDSRTFQPHRCPTGGLGQRIHLKKLGPPNFDVAQPDHFYVIFISWAGSSINIDPNLRGRR